MIKYMSAAILVIGLTATFGAAVRAQQPAAQPAPSAAPALPAKAESAPLLLKVQVVISRYQGEKKISSQPYMLTVTANGARANLTMGVQVPVPSSPLPSSGDGKTPPPSVQYRNVGTSIECGARSLDDGRFRLDFTIDDSSLAAEEQTPQPFAKGIPQFRSFRLSSETAVLRDGQTAQLTTATEKVTGEIAKVDVTLTVVK